ncbi:RNA polymerase sigma factor [Streptacidiphilus sp. MAP12-16]|uniref:RNA polymerase sigma factor n=1 Tax=Streptacidiphilus sp. MAP12-16 TaxID=3156300 RepID=UPI003511C8BC
MSAAQAGDERARDRIVAAYLPLVYNVVGRALEGHADVDDVVQETMLGVCRGLPQLREPERLRSWVVAIALNKVRTSRGQQWSARPRPLDDLAGDADPGADFEGLTILRLGLSGQRRETVEATRWLGSEDRELLSLWWLEAAGRLTREELATALDLEPQHAAVRVQRVKTQLETARTVVRALAADPRCAELAVAASAWDGRPAALWRKRLARHVRDCSRCLANAADLVPAEQLLVGLALVPLPAAPPLSAPLPHAAASNSAARRIGGHAARKTLAWKPVVAATAVGMVAAGGVVAYAQARTTAPVNAPLTVSAASRTAATARSSPAAAPTRTSAAAAAAHPAPPSAGLPASSTLTQRLTVTQLRLPAALHYLEPGYNDLAQWTRVAVATSPGGTVRVAWPAADGVHVTALTPALARSGADTVVPGTQEVGGLVAHNDGFALLTRVPDSNKWGDTAAALIRYRGSSAVFTDRLTGAASNDSSPGLAGQLAWNGSRYGAYFVVHGAGGPADGHYGDKLVYASADGTRQSGGWDWGCSHNEGIALYPEASGPFTSLCFDDWRSGLLVSTGIGAPDEAPVVQREQCWAGYCGGAFPDSTGAIARSASGVYATAFASRGAVAAVKNSQDSSGRGWTVAPRWSTHQVALAVLSNGSTPTGKPVYLTDDPGTDHVNVHIASYGKNRFLVSWESVSNASCASGTCTGRFSGTHLRLIDTAGHFLTPDAVAPAHISGDIAVLPTGDLVWAFTAATPDYRTPLTGSPSTTTLSLARLRLVGS